MIITPVPPLHDLGIFTAIGVLIAFWLAVFFLPAFVSLLPFRVPKAADEKQAYNVMESLGEFVLANKGVICISPDCHYAADCLEYFFHPGE